MSRKFQNNDCVGFCINNSNETEYGYIRGYNRKSKEYTIYHKWEEISLPETALTLMPRKEITSSELLGLLRYEISYSEFIKDIVPSYNFSISDEEIEFSLDDMTAMLTNLIKKKPSHQEFRDWITTVFDEDVLYCFILSDDENEIDVFGNSIPVDDKSMAECIFHAMSSAEYDLLWDDKVTYTDIINLQLMTDDLENYRKGKPIKQHLWTLNNKEKVCHMLDKGRLGKLTDDQKNDVRTIMDELVSRNIPKAIQTLGYSYYGGNDVYPCDWAASRECFMKLMDMDDAEDLDKCFYANTLGYIYYYGRCTDGVPDYENALKYFMMGAAGGIHESMYKLADMYIHGYGVQKNLRAAEYLIGNIYDESFKRITAGDFECKFADAALRMGNLCRDGIINEDEYYYYTLADFAIRKRMSFDHYGDNKVFMGIQKEIARIREERPLKKAGTLSYDYIPDIVYYLFHKYSCRVTVSPLKSGLSIKLVRLPKPSKEKPKKEFECYPEYGYCRLIDSITIKAACTEDTLPTDKTSFIADMIKSEYNDKTENIEYTFTHHDEKVFSFTADRFSYKLQMPSKVEMTEYTFASVEFSPGGRTYDYICEFTDVEIGDKVIVEGNGEEKEVEVRRLFRLPLGDMPLDVARYKKVIKSADIIS